MERLVAFSRPPQTSDEKRVYELIRKVAEAHKQEGFEHKLLPVVKYGFPGYVPGFTVFSDIVKYQEDKIYVNLDAIRGMSSDLAPITNFFPRSAAALPDLRQFLEPVKDLELSHRIGKALGQHLIQAMAKADHQNCWLFKKTNKSHIEFTRLLIYDGITEFFGRIPAPSSELISDDIWKRYNNDPSIGKPGSTRDWFTTKGGYTIVSPILFTYKTEGLHYLFDNPLRITRHFTLSPIPRYQAEAIRTLHLKQGSN